MVAAVTHHPAEFIQWEMPLAQALQYQAFYLDLLAREARLLGHPAAFTRAPLLTRGPDYTALAG